MSRILAIDYGKKRTGVAVTDVLQIIANGLTTVPTPTTGLYSEICGKRACGTHHCRASQANE